MRLLTSPTERVAAQPIRRVWPPAHPAQLQLLVASVAVIVGSFLPWVVTAIGTYNGIAGPGLWTFYAGIVGIAGSLIPFRRLAIGHGAILGVAAVALPIWQTYRLVSNVRFTGWQPGFGMAVVFLGGCVALRATSAIHYRRAE